MVEGRDLAERVIANVERVIVGKRTEIELIVIALLSQGHVLIEDVPGVGKTVLAKAIARSLGCSFRRIQFTPDLLPSDITGVSVFNQKTTEFEFRSGPVFANLVLADEINRATPKTQSALLEAMEEGQVTIDGVTLRLPEPFLVMATQNPIEYEGTFPLPEAQLDRFFLRVSLGYPDLRQEIAILDRQKHEHPLDRLGQVLTGLDLIDLQKGIRKIYVDDNVKQYIVTLVDFTRDHPDVYLGASPRGSLSLFRATQARALLKRRDFATPDDVKALAESVLSHRIVVSPAARLRNVSAQAVIADALLSVPVPGARVRA